MHKDSIVFNLLRLILWAFLLVFMAMLYWSSLLVEQDLQELKKEVSLLKEGEVVKEKSAEKEKNLPERENKVSQRPHLKDEYPNLLKEDLFYSKTLPEMLGKNFVPHGTRNQAAVGKPENLHPFSQWFTAREWIGLCTAAVSRSQVGKYETFAPDMAIKVELRPVEGKDEVEYWVHLRENVFWQPLDQATLPNNVTISEHFLKKHPVTSHDFKLYYDAIMNPFITEPWAITLRAYYSDVEEFKIIDDLTYVIRWKSYPIVSENGKTEFKNKYLAKGLTLSLTPLASFIYTYFPDGQKIVEESGPDTYRTNSIWAQNFSTHWAKNIIPSCGPWIFEGWTDRVVKFRRNPDHYFPYDVLVERLEIAIKDSFDNAWQDFKSGASDFFILQPDQLLEFNNFLKSPAYAEQVKKGLRIKRLDYVARSYSYVGWNETKPFFNDSKLREALTLAIDRNRIIKQNMNNMALEIVGTFYLFSPNYDRTISPLPYDPEKAKRLLEEEGWYDTEGDGILRKTIEGKKIPFEFSLTYYAKNPLAKSIVEYITTALKEVGIKVIPKGVDIADLSAELDDKSFDAYILAWALGDPPEDPRQIWYSALAKEKGSSNTIGFQNKKIDDLIDKLTYEYDPEKRILYYHQFDKILYEEMPYAFLFTPKAVFLYREYLQNVFIPAERQDLIPGANVAEPITSLFWLKQKPKE